MGWPDRLSHHPSRFQGRGLRWINDWPVHGELTVLLVETGWAHRFVVAVQAARSGSRRPRSAQANTISCPNAVVPSDHDWNVIA